MLISYNIPVVSKNFVLGFKNSNWKKFMKWHFYVENSSSNQGKPREKVIESNKNSGKTQGKSTWKQQKLRGNSGKKYLKTTKTQGKL